jgi:hypothetical protein
MKFITIEDSGRPFWFACYRCGKNVKSTDGWRDLEGVPFLAYYCEPCKERAASVDAAERADFAQQGRDLHEENVDRTTHAEVCARCRRNSNLPGLLRRQLCRVGGPNRQLDEAALRGEEVP